MATFVFSGDPKAPGRDPAECGMFGMTFPFGKEVEVKDKEITKRLRRHNHFTEVGGKAKDEPKAEPVMAEPKDAVQG